MMVEGMRDWRMLCWSGSEGMGDAWRLQLCTATWGGWYHDTCYELVRNCYLAAAQQCPGPIPSLELNEAVALAT